MKKLPETGSGIYADGASIWHYPILGNKDEERKRRATCDISNDHRNVGHETAPWREMSDKLRFAVLVLDKLRQVGFELNHRTNEEIPK
jgi:hypothetical protein